MAVHHATDGTTLPRRGATLVRVALGRREVVDDIISLSLSQPRCRSHTNESPSLFWRLRPTIRSARRTSTKDPPRTEEPMEEAGDRGPRNLSPSLVRPGSARPEPGPGEKPETQACQSGVSVPRSNYREEADKQLPYKTLNVHLFRPNTITD
ncbi:hypothetical protein E2C01_023472 [Portunus trituberculatus]|uniref:Uncharacterized protein n=1 Tax=Portunus trituberculatus TaxID=210409 RepID=A0A5B7EB82_PORTR|nr:hypothetical protein [Portunus trituberculatus]